MITEEINITRVSCPACSQPIELPSLEVGRVMNCPSCNHSFTPREVLNKNFVAQPKPALSAARQTSEYSAVNSAADTLVLWAWISTVAGVLVIAVSFAQSTRLWSYVGAGIFCFGLWLFFMGQLFRIRAALEKK